MNLNDIFDQVGKFKRLETEVQATQKLVSLVEGLRHSPLDGIAKSNFSAVSALKNATAQTDWITLGIVKRDPLAAVALGKIEFPSYVTTRLNDLLYPDSASVLANHVLALRDQASVIGKLNFSVSALQPVMAATSQPSQAAITAHLPASITSAAYQPSNVVKDLITFKAAADSQLIFKGVTENAIPNLFNFGTAAAAFSPSKTEVMSAAAAITSPWIEPANALRSFESMAGLISIGKAISASPFSHQASNAVGSLLGDWNHEKTLPAIPADWQSRREFYFEHGFDRRLTDFPEPAFTQALISADILRPDLFSPVFPRGGDDYSRFITSVPAKEPEEKEESEQDTVKQRMLEAYDLLFNLETQLREYITEVMTEHCGPKWIKQRVPEPMRNHWNEKKQTAREKGEGDYPLIWYADFSDYVHLITRKDNWSEVFEKVFSNQIDLQASFYRLQPLRISTMHARPITQEDFLLLTVEIRRLLCAIGK